MNHSIKLGFIGANQIDIIQYLSRVAYCLGYQVAVVDGSIEQRLSLIIPDSIDSEIISYNGVDCYIHKSHGFSDIDFSKYDFILMNYGLNPACIGDLASLTILFAVSNFEIDQVMGLKKFIQLADLRGIKVVKVYRDIVTSKITPKYINHILKLEEVAEVLEEYLIPLTEGDIVARLSCQYDDRFQFKSLSKKYRDLLMDIFSETKGEQPKRIEQAIKYAGEGKSKICK